MLRQSRCRLSGPKRPDPKDSGILPERVGHRRVLPQARILVQGRGSAANSTVCYALGITAVDPVGMDLPSGDDRERAIQYWWTRKESNLQPVD